MTKQNLGIVGSGKLATHLMHYLDLEGIKYINWNRKNDSIPPKEKLKETDRILLLISDDSILDFIVDNPSIQDKKLFHFSGSLNINEAIGVHPLMSFNDELYSLETYREIPFIGSDKNTPISSIIPGLLNPYYTIEKKDKSFYHALCVISGNFSAIIWDKAVRDFKNKLNLPEEVLHPYMEQVFKNIQNNPSSALTGPIKRGDKDTIKRNRKALKSRTWSTIYRLFNKTYKENLK